MSVVYVASGGNNSGSNNAFIAYSNNAQTWTQSSNASNVFKFPVLSLANNGQMWVGTSNVGTGSSSIGYSYDGITWYPSANGNSVISIVAVCVAHANGLWVAVGAGTYTIAYSYDGITWTGAANSTFFGSGGGYGQFVTYKNSTWVALGINGTNQSKIAYSYDGINWTLITDTKLNKYAMSIDWNGTNWVAVGSNSTDTAQIIYSSSLTGTWTIASGNSIFGANGYGYSVVWNGSYFLATGTVVAGVGKLARSTDGINWTVTSPSTFSTFDKQHQLLWTGSFWIVGQVYVSGYGTILTSPDGITWTATTTNPAGTVANTSFTIWTSKLVTLNSTTPVYNINNANLLYYYPFDSNYLNYQSGSGVSNVSNLVSTAIVPGITKLNNGSLYFGGITGESIQVPATTFSTNGLTFSLWMKTTEIPSSSFTSIFEFGSGINNKNIVFFFINAQMYFVVYNPSSGTTVSGTNTYLNYTLADTNWHHYCLTLSSSRTLSFYVDGVQMSGISFNAYPATSQLTTCFLAKSSFAASAISCYMNQFLVFNRVITSTELSYLVNYPSQVKLSGPVTGNVIYNINNTGLLQYYPFDNDLLNYATGSGVSDGTTNLTSIATTNTKLSSGSLYFPGSPSQYFKASNPSLNTTNGMTFSIWAKFTTIPSFNNGSNFRLFDYATGINLANIALYFVDGPYFGATKNQLTLYTTTNYVTTFNLADNNWHHYCATISANNTPTGFFTFNVYVDGNVILSSTVASSNYPTSTTSLASCFIGQSNATGEQTNANQPVNYFNQALVFNRVINASELYYLSNYPSQVEFSSLSSSVYVPPPPPYPCFKEGTRILRLDPETDDEEYVPVESLRRGDLIRTHSSGYKAISFIGKRILSDPASNPDPKNRLYRFKKSISPKMTEDLYITGEHCTLRRTVTEEQLFQIRDHMGDVYVTEKHIRCPACLDERATPDNNNDSEVTIWHFALENDNAYHNYGVYANGLLVESCSIEHMVNRSNLELI